MRASKEECSKAQDATGRIDYYLRHIDKDGSAESITAELTDIRRFLNAAHKRLPTEASYRKDKKRKICQTGRYIIVRKPPYDEA